MTHDMRTPSEKNEDLCEALITMRTASRSLETSPEFTAIFRDITRALRSRSLSDLKAVQSKIKKMHISSSLGVESGVNHLVKGFEELFGNK